MTAGGRNCTNVDAVTDSCYTVVTLIFTTCCIGVIIIVIVFGNALVIAAVLKDKRLKQQLQNWLIVSLAIADCLVGLLVTPLTLAYELLGSWQFGQFLCEIWLALDVLFVTASILNLCAISLDRYWCITNPVYYPGRRTPRRMMAMILVVWTLAFAISFPPLVGWRDARLPGECHISRTTSYVLYSASGSFFIPVTIILGVYAKIYSISRRRALRKNETEKRRTLLLQSATITPDYYSCDPNRIQINGCHNNSNSTASRRRLFRCATAAGKYFRFRSKRFNSDPIATPAATVVTLATADSISGDEYKNGNTATVVTATAVAAGGHRILVDGDHASTVLNPADVQQQLLWRRKIQKRRERQATLILGLILAAFIVCWLPFFIIYVLEAVCCQTPEIVFDIFFWLGYCNSGLNPVIYNYLNPDYRRAFRKILSFGKM